ncbi:hypothetical protein GCM10027062_24820 [Nocardioides hungaricus]
METLAPIRHGHLAAALFDTGRLDAPASSQHWRVARDGDPLGSALYRRHYSARRYADGRRPALFVGPGEKLVLIAHDDAALFVWRRFIDASGQTGVNCAVFRNESTELSSELIADAEPFAWRRWPGQRLYTYVDAAAIRSTNPGFCFQRAGWRRCGVTKGGLIVLERLPHLSTEGGE